MGFWIISLYNVSTFQIDAQYTMLHQVQLFDGPGYGRDAVSVCYLHRGQGYLHYGCGRSSFLRDVIVHVAP